MTVACAIAQHRSAGWASAVARLRTTFFANTDTPLARATCVAAADLRAVALGRHESSDLGGTSIEALGNAPDSGDSAPVPLSHGIAP